MAYHRKLWFCAVSDRTPGQEIASVVQQHTEVFTTECLGPAMIALNQNQRRFVQYLTTSGDDDFARAAAYAGYPLRARSDSLPANVVGAQRAIGRALASNPKVLAAVKEEARKRLSSAVGIAAHGLIEIIKDATVPANHRLKAIDMLLNRGGITEDVAVQKHAHLHVAEIVDRNSGAEAMARVTGLATQLGIDSRALAAVIEGKRVQVVDGKAEEVEEW